MAARREFKRMGGLAVEVKEGNVNGVPVGLISGHIATFALDEGLDKFIPGAFLESLARHRHRKLADKSLRPIPLKNEHRNLVGGWPQEGLGEDSKGLFGKDGQINLEVQEGQELFSKLRANHISALSIGFSALDFSFEGDVRLIQKAEFWEGSPVGEPMNQDAGVTDVKSAQFCDLTIASKDVEWEGYDGDDDRAYLYGSKALAQWVDGELVVVQERLQELAVELLDSEAKDPAQIRVLERYFTKAGLESPFPSDLRRFYRLEDLKALTPRALESVLERSGSLTKGAQKWLVAGVRADLEGEGVSLEDKKLVDRILAGLKGSREALQ